MKKILLIIIYLLSLWGFFGCTPQKQVFKTDNQKIPVTNLRFNDAEDKVQFLIISDRTGGMQPGVFRKASSKINQLQPQFILSVGDLIDGYTYDSLLLNQQWKEFDEIVENNFDMPFFYVPGNHDISNKWMEEEWKKRLGQPYYHFIYKDILFLSLHTEDNGEYGISEAQANYFAEVLEKNQEVRWTFLLMHRPLWDYGDQGGYEHIEKALQGRKYTLFSGHHHHYLYAEKAENKHFILGTTGGGSHLRGKEFGEFHHVTWVTFEKEEPEIINIAIDGLVEKDIVNKQNYELVQTLRMGNFFKINPTVSTQKEVEKITTKITFYNPAQEPLYISANLPSYEDVKFYPTNINLKIAPKDSLVQEISLKAQQGTFDLSKLPILNLECYGRYGTGEQILKLPTRKEWVIDWYKSTIPSPKITLDGLLSEWDTTNFIHINHPGYLRQGWDWHGINDGLMTFQVAEDLENINIASVIYDKDFVYDIDKRCDKFYLYFENAQGKRFKSVIIPPTKENEQLKRLQEIKGLQTKITKFEGGLFLEASINKKQLEITKRDHNFRFNIGFMDHDNIQNTKPSEIFWKPVWDSAQTFDHSGIFLLQ